MKAVSTGVQICLALLLFLTGAMAQANKPATPPAPTPLAAASPAPDRTTASFGDWILRCERRGTTICELGQAYQRQGESGPQAQLALGRISPSEPVRFTVLLPINVALQSAPKVTLEGTSGQTLSLAWIRCLATGCFANATVGDEALKKLSQQKDPGRLEYRDGADRETLVPISFRGFTEALEAFQRESVK